LGNDTLVGGFGYDTLTGGENADSFTFYAAYQQVDAISDFVAADDTIIVSASGFGGGLTVGAAITSAQFALGTAATNSDQRFIYDNNGALFFDMDGSGSIAAVQLATLSNKAAITNADIFVTA
jgi:Ca2+-binding RTX toxin-like protein